MKKFNDIWVFIEMSNNRPKRVSLELLAKAAELAAEAGSKAVPVICPKTSDYSPPLRKRLLLPFFLVLHLSDEKSVQDFPPQ